MKPRRPTLKVCFRSFSFFLLAISSVQAKEPYYKGKSLSDWLSYDLGADAPAAIQQMGTNAIPTLLDLMGATPKTIRWVAVRLDSKRMREQLRNDDGDVYFGEIKEAVVLAFTVLGTNAESAVPKMVKFLNEDNDDVSIYAAAALGVVGPKGFAALTNALNSPNPSIRVDVAIGISKSGQGFKLLIALLKDQDQRVREVTVNSLGNADPALAIPALVPLLDDKEPDMRQSAAGALSNYGPKAKSAAPKILSLYTNSQDGRFFVDLKRIDLETARKAEALVVNNGPLNPNRQGYTKTMMKNGLELIAGGYVHTELQSVNNHFLSSAEIYDPKTGTWTETGEMTGTRYGHAAVLLSSGKVLVTGGSAGKRLLSSAELYDPATGKWTPTTSMCSTHYGCKARLNPDGTVLVFREIYNNAPP
ncbi:MAG: HEAT repeat domain-containing protein [Verrucomicrobiia bacterium]